MIMEAIESTNVQKGSSKAEISQHIETNHSDLPAAHSALLDYYLKQMKVSGELVMANGNYTKPDPNAPAKRGRGRPPKLNSSPPDGSVAPAQPRSRGRPPKSKGAWDLPAQAKNASIPVSSRKRGRPAKAEKPEQAPAEEATSALAGEVSPAKRGRGRPPKVKPTVVPIGA